MYDNVRWSEYLIGCWKCWRFSVSFIVASGWIFWIYLKIRFGFVLILHLTKLILIKNILLSFLTILKKKKCFYCSYSPFTKTKKRNNEKILYSKKRLIRWMCIIEIIWNNRTLNISVTFRTCSFLYLCLQSTKHKTKSFKHVQHKMWLGLYHFIIWKTTQV